ncbi:MAG: hypothetical protein HY043_03655, partial [Verrucomicrobia bacterium]|nr:hypothetical protein [Verrucomicrobiota bacterium]
LASATTRLEVATEFDAAPVPKITPTVLRATTDDQLRQTMAEPDFTDAFLDFSSMQMLPGRAFELAGENVGVMTTNQFIPVGKQWQVIDGRSFLFEQVEYPAVLPLLKALPDTKQARVNSTSAPQRLAAAQTGGASVPTRPNLVHSRVDEENITARPEPRPPVPSTGRVSVPASRDLHRRAFAEALPPVPITKPATSIVQPTQIASHPRGVAIDYTILGSQSTPFTFQGDVTYAVVAGCNFSAAVTLEGGAVIKSARYNQFTTPDYTMGVHLFNPATLNCLTTPYRPAIFTCKDDDSVGEKLPNITVGTQTWPGSTGSPIYWYAYRGIAFWSPSLPTDMHDVRFSYAVQAYGAFNAPASPLNSLRHAQITYSQVGLDIYNASVALRNVLVSGSSYAACGVAGNPSPSSSIIAENVTFDGGSYLFTPTSNGSIFTFNNCLITGISAQGNGFYTGLGNYQPGSSAGVYQTIGAGAHYLAVGSPHRNAGVTSINAQLLADLQSRTTYPPTAPTTAYSINATLSPDLVNVPRDNDNMPDRGYHYDPIDYAWGGLTLNSGVTLVLTNGVAIAAYGNKGLTMQSGSKLISEGTPTALNRLTRFHTVQELATSSWNGSTLSAVSILEAATSATWETRLRFTDISLMNDTETRHQLLSNTPSAASGVLALADCQLRGVTAQFYSYNSFGPAYNFTNNLVLRSRTSFTQISGLGFLPLTVNLYNNTFSGGLLNLTYGDSSSVWTVRDNLFDSLSLGVGTQYFTHDHNAYSATTGNSILNGPTSGNITTGLAQPLDYQSGPAANWYGVEGGWYLNTTGGKLSQLLAPTAGSRSPVAAGLYHYTPRTTLNYKEGTDATIQRTAIGFHYVGANSQSQPIDTDADGAPDYWEDRNGNNQFDFATGTNPFGVTTNSIETQLNGTFTLQTSFAGAHQSVLAPPVPDNGELVPDVMGAIGPGHFVELINGGIYVFNRAGGFLKFATLDAFFALTLTSSSGTTNFPRNGSFDPRILYDPSNGGHWIACALEHNGDVDNQFLIAVSKTNDPLGNAGSTWIQDNWNKFWVNIATASGKLTDFDTLGMDANGVYVAALRRTTGPLNPASDYSAIVAIPKSLLYATAPSPTLSADPKVKKFDTAVGVFFVQPAINFDAVAATGPAWFVRVPYDVGSSSIYSTTVTWDVNGVPQAPGAWQPINNAGIAYEAVPTGDIPQPATGSTIFKIVDPKAGLSATVIRNGILWTSHTVGVGGSARSGCQWLNFSISGTTLTFGASSTVSHSTRWYYYPSLMVNARGEMLMGFAGSSSAENVGVWYVTRTAGGSLGTVQSPKAGENAIFTVTNPGDYSSTTLDPNDGVTFWTIQEYANQVAVPSGPPWGTWIIAISPY